MGCLPPRQDARFVAAMEDVLEVYERPFDPLRPLVCLDEAAKQILSDKREPIPMKPAPAPAPASVARYDNEYKREGTCALFMLSQPLLGQREVLVRDRRTALDYAQITLKWCAICAMRCTPKPKQSCWFRILSILTVPGAYMKPSSRKKRTDWRLASSGITLQNTAP